MAPSANKAYTTPSNHIGGRMTQPLLDVLTQLASTLYGGTLCAFALLIALYPRSTGRPREEVARVYRSVGPILGLAMGCWVFGLLASRYLAHGAFSWSWDTPEGARDMTIWIVFGILWFSSFVLEIWTAEPFRSCTNASNEVTDLGGFNKGYGRVSLHILVNAALVIAWQSMFCLDYLR